MKVSEFSKACIPQNSTNFITNINKYLWNGDRTSQDPTANDIVAVYFSTLHTGELAHTVHQLQLNYMLHNSSLQVEFGAPSQL